MEKGNIWYFIELISIFNICIFHCFKVAELYLKGNSTKVTLLLLL